MSDYFEIKEEDLLGRIGQLRTRRESVETPTLAPVIDPGKNLVPPSEIVNLGFNLVMTNAYLIKKRYGGVGLELGVHGILGIKCPIMTDSGAYQLMEYGEVEVAPLEIVEYQVNLGSDIGVILDIPTRYGSSRETVAREVEETLRRAREALAIDRKGMLLVGPIQGGTYLDLVFRSATEMATLDFDLYAVGGPVQLMMNYSYSELVRLFMTAKLYLPPGKPVHLFGAGNPHMLALAVAMGADLFDSASYALYARRGRYMTPHGVYMLEEMGDLPCECSICSKLTVKEFTEMPYQERVYMIAVHNLNVLRGELRRIKNAIHEGRLWELIELRARSHPSLAKALNEFRKYTFYVEKFHKVTKGLVSGLFFYEEISRARPEVYRHLSRLRSRYTPPAANAVILALETEIKPFSRFGWIADLKKQVTSDVELSNKVHIVVVTGAFGPIPIELDSVYPLSQHESAIDLKKTMNAQTIAADVAWYLTGLGCHKVAIIVYDEEQEHAAKKIAERLRKQGLPAYTRSFKSVSDVISFVKMVFKLHT
ncbi:MAG: tRNA guanosine(15) transglycosylase TgtA [Thermofilaceae archaeon]